MWDAEIAALAGRQFNRISRAQVLDLGLSEKAIVHRLAAGRLWLSSRECSRSPRSLRMTGAGGWEQP